jgi:hypothetical protein
VAVDCQAIHQQIMIRPSVLVQKQIAFSVCIEVSGIFHSPTATGCKFKFPLLRFRPFISQMEMLPSLFAQAMSDFPSAVKGGNLLHSPTMYFLQVRRHRRLGSHHPSTRSPYFR